jgi:hypothetical protein
MPRSGSREHHCARGVNSVVNTVDIATSDTYCGVIEFDDETRVS